MWYSSSRQNRVCSRFHVMFRVQDAGPVISDLHRLATFASCPVSEWSTVSCLKLANCGFIYAGHSDNLVCQRCGFELSGWLETKRNPTAEHRCPHPITTVKDVPLSEVHQDSTIYAIYVTAVQRAARNGALQSAETHHLRPDEASTLVPTQPASDSRRRATSSDDNVISSGDSDDDNVLTLKLSLSKRHSSMICHCPWCVHSWLWQYMGICPLTAHGY